MEARGNVICVLEGEYHSEISEVFVDYLHSDTYLTLTLPIGAAGAFVVVTGLGIGRDHIRIVFLWEFLNLVASKSEFYSLYALSVFVVQSAEVFSELKSEPFESHTVRIAGEGLSVDL